MKRTTAFLFLIILIASCRKELKTDYPVIFTGEVKNIDESGADFIAKISGTGQTGECEYGFAWGLKEYPDVSSSIVEFGTKESSGVVSARITYDLYSDTTYYVRAWSRNGSFMTYGNQVKFRSMGSLPPEITGFSPSEGCEGTKVIIRGTNFGAMAGTISVMAGTLETTVDSASAERVVVRLPSSVDISGPVKFRLTVAGRSAISKETILLKGVQLGDIVPGNCWTGDTVTITGSNFSLLPEENILRIGGIQILPFSCNTDQMKVIVPYNVPFGLNRLFVTVQGKTFSQTREINVLNPWEAFMISDYAFYRRGIVAFGLENKGYMGFGYDAVFTNKILGDFYCYDPVTNVITRLAALPGDGRMNAAGFAVNGKGYVALGQNSQWINQESVWKYDPLVDTWTRMKDFPGKLRWEPAGLAIGNKAYLGFGYFTSSEPANDLWEYDPENDLWKELTPCPGNLSGPVQAFSDGNSAYFLFGLDIATYGSCSEVWRYTPTSGIWTRMADFPGTVPWGAVTFYMDGTGYTTMGTHDRDGMNSTWSFTPPSDTWLRLGNLPFTSRYGSKSFVSGSRAYITGGHDLDNASYYGSDIFTFITWSKNRK